MVDTNKLQDNESTFLSNDALKDEKSKGKILLIISRVQCISSQGIRYHNLISNFGVSFDIKVVTLYPDTFFNRTNSINTKGNFFTKTKKVLKWFFKHMIEGFIFPDRFIFKIADYKRLINKAFLAEHFDYVILGITPFSFYSLALYIKRIKPEICLIVDLSDPFINNGANYYWIPLLKLRIKKYERKYLAHVDKLIVLNHSVKLLYTNTYKFFKSENIFVVEQGVREEYILKKDNNIDRTTQDKIIKLLYAGGLYPKLREPYELYKAIEFLRYKDVILEIYGNISKAFVPMGNDRILYKGTLSQTELFEEYLTHQILVFLDNSIGIQVPGKLFEVISQNKPVLFIYSNPASPSLGYLERANNVFIVKNDASKIQSVVEAILSTNLNSYKGADVSDFTWGKLTEKYCKAIERGII